MNTSAYRVYGSVMRLIFIYGPPGAGKFTVANALSRLTGYAVFHNHIAIDLVRKNYGYGSSLSEDLIRAVNLAAIKTMSVEGKDLIFTYSRPNDRSFITEAAKSVKQYGGRMLFVRLTCSMDEIRRRIRLRSGSTYSKITDMKSFRKFEEVHGPFSGVWKGISIDTTSAAPEESAIRIARMLKLSR